MFGVELTERGIGFFIGVIAGMIIGLTLPVALKYTRKKEKSAKEDRTAPTKE